jgi:ketosteroid isomerase-like protein
MEKIMKLRVWLLSALVALGSLNTLAVAATDDESALLALEQKWIDASKAQDVATLDAIIDDSYQADTPGGIESKRDMLKTSAAGPTQSLQNLNVTVNGDRGTVYGDNLLTFADGNRVKLSFVDRFERKHGQWRIVRSFVTR